MPVDALGIVASLLERLEVRITRWDLTNVLGPIELACNPDRHDPTAETFREPIVVVPAERAAPTRVAMRPHTFERYEHRVAGFGDLAEPDAATVCGADPVLLTPGGYAA